MDLSPFPTHGPLEPHQLVGRDDDVRHLVEQVTGRRPTVLVAPRRFGKTSVIRAVTAQLAPTTTVIEVDLYELRSWADLAVRFDVALARVDGTPRRRLDEIALGFEVNLGFVKASVTGRNRGHPDLTVDRLVDVIVAHAERHPTLLVLDEFSSIERLDGAAGLLRTRLQHHFSKIGLLFAGSEPSTMRMLFSAIDQPFYAQADLVNLPALDLATVRRIVDDGFDHDPPKDLGALVFRFADGHPHRTMQLADAAWRARSAGTDDTSVWHDALDDVRRLVADGFETRFASLTVAHQAVLRLVAGGEPLHGTAADVLSLSSSSADLARRSLVDDGHVAAHDGRLRVVDPVFADWIRRRFPL